MIDSRSIEVCIYCKNGMTYAKIMDNIVGVIIANSKSGTLGVFNCIFEETSIVDILCDCYEHIVWNYGKYEFIKEAYDNNSKIVNFSNDDIFIGSRDFYIDCVTIKNSVNVNDKRPDRFCDSYIAFENLDNTVDDKIYKRMKSNNVRITNVSDKENRVATTISNMIEIMFDIDVTEVEKISFYNKHDKKCEVKNVLDKETNGLLLEHIIISNCVVNMDLDLRKDNSVDVIRKILDCGFKLNVNSIGSVLDRFMYENDSCYMLDFGHIKIDIYKNYISGIEIEIVTPYYDNIEVYKKYYVIDSNGNKQTLYDIIMLVRMMGRKKKYNFGNFNISIDYSDYYGASCEKLYILTNFLYD